MSPIWRPKRPKLRSTSLASVAGGLAQAVLVLATVWFMVTAEWLQQNGYSPAEALLASVPILFGPDQCTIDRQSDLPVLPCSTVSFAALEVLPALLSGARAALLLRLLRPRDGDVRRRVVALQSGESAGLRALRAVAGRAALAREPAGLAPAGGRQSGPRAQTAARREGGAARQSAGQRPPAQADALDPSRQRGRVQADDQGAHLARN
ncbi:hypothetical protein ON010_g10965 [Phytophthora cinnamomi]|nr:hypothetical protein ON010_g10965 [Phytophthora cinnamomi]